MKVAIQDLLRKIENNKLNVHEGVFSVCSSNPYVIEASLNKSKETNDFLLIEATCNQVNQFGGYTGKTPEGFSKFIFSLAHKAGFPEEKIILGGDHLGPYPWRNQKAKVAMSNSEDLVRAYVKSGFEKIHLDTSIYCIDDNQSLPMSNQLSADRAVQLCKAAENTASTENIEKPIYVIGTEVPLPGGQQSQDDSLQLTTVENIKETLAIFKETFYREGLSLAWERVVALVVQPGVEFGDNDIIEYQPEKAQSLKEYVENNSEIVYEAHSTDYQTKENLYNLVSDHFAILKVGPALTFSFREAVFGLQKIEEELSKTSREIKKNPNLSIQFFKQWIVIPRIGKIIIGKVKIHK